MIHLRIVSPPDRSHRVTELLCGDPSVCNVISLPGAAMRPDGDVVLADVAREDASLVVEALKGLGLEEDGSIAVEHIDTSISKAARRAVKAAQGAEADAVVWEEVEATTSEESALSWTFALFMILASTIAAAGILTNSPILIVGAMIVGPEFGPLAGVCVAAVQRRRHLLLRSLLALGVGFPAAIGATYLVTEALLAGGLRPDAFSFEEGQALLISSPDAYSVLVAAAAGMAGMLSLTTAKSGALIGVLVSVTTIPAAAEVGVGAAGSDWHAAGGAAAQLGVNLTTIVVVGILTLVVQRNNFKRRRRHHAEAMAPAAATAGPPPASS